MSYLFPGSPKSCFLEKWSRTRSLLDAERQKLEGIGLATQRDRVAGERLALRLAVGAAHKRAYLSYPRIDIQQARPRVPSFYGLETLRAAEGELPGFEELGLRPNQVRPRGSAGPRRNRPARPIDEAEYDLALLGRLVDADPETTAGTAHYLLDSNAYLARSLRARSRKWLRVGLRMTGWSMRTKQQSTRSHRIALDAVVLSDRASKLCFVSVPLLSSGRAPTAAAHGTGRARDDRSAHARLAVSQSPVRGADFAESSRRVAGNAPEHRARD